jgi:ubiquinone/menaquinone biosynthesis C-methylase UbiE
LLQYQGINCYAQSRSKNFIDEQQLIHTLSNHFDPVSYKEELKKLWNEKAEFYHERYASKKLGPFLSLDDLISVAQLKKDERVLDIATGTGIVASEALKKVGNEGRIVGIDLSPGPLEIARKTLCDNPNVQLLEMDAEDLRFPDGSFDIVLSEFALMFFPDSQKALREMRRVLVRGGRIAVSVHGSAERVPYFSVIMNPLIKYVPDIVPPGRPSIHRFGDPDVLKAEFEKSGFTDIRVEVHTYPYPIGTFEEYWSDYMESAAASMRSRIESLDPSVYSAIKREAESGAGRYVRNGRIEFPWEVLIASARS